MQHRICEVRVYWGLWQIIQLYFAIVPLWGTELRLFLRKGLLKANVNIIKSCVLCYFPFFQIKSKGKRMTCYVFDFLYGPIASWVSSYIPKLIKKIDFPYLYSSCNRLAAVEQSEVELSWAELGYITSTSGVS